jgi:hypothetical protein
MSKKAIGCVVLFIIIICIGWLVLSAIMVSKTLFPSSSYLVTASEGAALRVENGGIISLSNNAGSFGMTSFNPILKPLIAVPAIAVFIMAIYGCVCLINKSKPVLGS